MYIIAYLNYLFQSFNQKNKKLSYNKVTTNIIYKALIINNICMRLRYYKKFLLLYIEISKLISKINLFLKRYWQLCKICIWKISQKL